MGKRVIFILFLLTAFFGISGEFSEAIDPQYIFVRKSPNECNPSDCSMLWNMAQPEKDFTLGINDIFNKVGTRGNDQRKLGAGILLHYNGYNFSLLKSSLTNLLASAKSNNIPLFIGLDGFQWWGDNNNNDGSSRFDLWKWWDPTISATEKEKRKNNVEWTCWNNSCAINKSWRNWGFEFELGPHPNLGSQDFVDDNKKRLGELIPIIVNWYRGLDNDKKWLLGGVSLGVEVDIGGNYYYYNNGINNGGGLTASSQLGYAALKSAGIRSSGGAPTAAEIDIVVQRYLNVLDKFAYDNGIPREKIFNHVGGSDIFPEDARPANNNYQTSNSASNEYGNPGWSFYGNISKVPQNYSIFNSVLDRNYTYEWGSPEWLTSENSYDGWLNALNNSLNYRNNRLINVANWEGIRDKTYAVEAIRTALNQSPNCWVTSPTISQVKVENSKVIFFWNKGLHNEKNYIHLSTSNETNSGAGFKNLNIANVEVTNVNTWQRENLNPSTYYWQFITDGCSNQRRRVSGKIVVNQQIINPSPTQIIQPTATIGPAILPTLLPTITLAPLTDQKCGQCTNISFKKSQGDADCQGNTTLNDASIWRSEFVAGEMGSVNKTTWQADFDCDSKITLNDFSIWRSNYINYLQDL